ncbi:hypothetical protein OA067_03015 [Gammaproteobacteria bacterium]|nr:hypothetical protein [Gammaproteobacteria bacterium]
MKWVKKGLIFSPEMIESDLIKSHAQIPTVLLLEDRLRVYFATRPIPGLSLTVYIDLDTQNPKEILAIGKSPILALGENGQFDEHGIMPNFVYKDGEQIHLQYVGWSRRESIPYSNWMGLASSKNGDVFSRRSNVPFLDRAEDEIFSATGTWMIKEENSYYLFYAKGGPWLNIKGNLESQYNIVSAKSKDGIFWDRGKREILPRLSPTESTTRPSIINIDGLWHMWFCFRGPEAYRDGSDSYRIGYAYSKNLTDWVRDDKRSGIGISETGWDSKMIAYPYVIETPYGCYMFYNGNGFGQTGFGYASLE